MRLNAKSSNTVSSHQLQFTIPTCQHPLAAKRNHAMQWYIQSQKSSNCEFNPSTLRRNTRKDTPNRHKATNYINFIQSIYKYNRRATNSRQRPNSLNLRRRGPFTWIYISIEIFHVIGRYYFSMSKEPNQPNKTSPAKPARQIPESSGIPTCYSSINTVVKVKSNPLNPIKSHYIKK